MPRPAAPAGLGTFNAHVSSRGRSVQRNLSAAILDHVTPERPPCSATRRPSSRVAGFLIAAWANDSSLHVCPPERFIVTPRSWFEDAAGPSMAPIAGSLGLMG